MRVPTIAAVLAAAIAFLLGLWIAYDYWGKRPVVLDDDDDTLAGFLNSLPKAERDEIIIERAVRGLPPIPGFPVARLSPRDGDPWRIEESWVH